MKVLNALFRDLVFLEICRTSSNGMTELHWQDFLENAFGTRIMCSFGEADDFAKTAAKLWQSQMNLSRGNLMQIGRD